MLLCLLMQKQSGYNILRPVGLWRLFKDEATEEKGVRAKMASFVGAMVIADLVKMTLWPKGLAKLVENLGEGIKNGTRDQHFDSLDVKWLQTFTTMWVFVKGVITAEDSKNGQNLNLVQFSFQIGMLNLTKWKICVKLQKCFLCRAGPKVTLNRTRIRMFMMIIEEVTHRMNFFSKWFGLC